MGSLMHMLAATGTIGGTGVAAGLLFYVFAGMAVAGAAAAAMARDAGRAGLGLLLALTGVAGLYFLLHAEFLAAAELLVAAGGIAAMLLIGVGMLGKREAALFGRRPGWNGRRVGAVLAGGGCGMALIVLAAMVPWTKGGGVGAGAVGDLGGALVGGGYLAVEAVMALGLMTVLVGGAYMARAKRPAEPGGPAVVRTLAPVRKSASGAGRGGVRR